MENETALPSLSQFESFSRWELLVMVLSTVGVVAVVSAGLVLVLHS